MAFQRFNERRLGERPELARESFLPVGLELLVAEDQDAIIGESAAEFGDGFLKQRL